MSSGGYRSWGAFPPHEQEALPLAWRDELAARLEGGAGLLPFGNGRSYGDVCHAASARVLPMRGLDRLLWADWEKGVVRAEAGVTLGELLALTIPRGWFLPVVPGTQQVTLGGAVANDVHGKNHHRQGTFGSHVISLELQRSQEGASPCSRLENPALFAATIGGLGLTGVITAVEVQLKPLGSSQLACRHRRFESLAEFLSLCEAMDADHEYTVAWLDCQSAGRGVFSAANHLGDDQREVARQDKLAMPFTPPLSLVNTLSTSAMNKLLYRWQGRRPEEQCDYQSALFPLDGIAHWNRCYGHRGFQQYQCVIPGEQAEDAMTELLRQIRQHGSASFLSVLKLCGNARSPGLLSFPMPGISLALDFPQHATLEPLFAAMDRVVQDAGGRLYPAKDAHMSAEFFQAAYPRWQELERLRDPALLSNFWRRVTGIES